LIGLSTLIVAIKNGGSILKEYAKLIVRLWLNLSKKHHGGI
jgi:hypothetical protein